LAGPYEKFQESFEAFEQQIDEKLETFKTDLVKEMAQIALGEPFDPLVFRLQLLKDIEQKLDSLKEDLATTSNLPTLVPPKKKTAEEWVIDFLKEVFFIKKG
jgi:hypothetical protein